LINSTIVSAIIIFNLSIVYHLKGLEGGSGSISSMRLRKARALYQKSQNLLIDAGVPLGATGNPVIDVLSMALFNNLAHVAFELSSYEESRQFFDFLIRFALTVVPSKYGDAFVAALLDQQKSSFLLNAIILQVPKLAPAA
jgi:tetratricopeptide (TPR) repeat protein